MPPLPLHLMFGIKYKGCRVVFFAEFLFKPRNLIFHVHTVQRRLVEMSMNLLKVFTINGFHNKESFKAQYDNWANILTAFNKEKAIVGAFTNFGKVR